MTQDTPENGAETAPEGPDTPQPPTDTTQPEIAPQDRPAWPPKVETK